MSVSYLCEVCLHSPQYRFTGTIEVEDDIHAYIRSEEEAAVESAIARGKDPQKARAKARGKAILKIQRLGEAEAGIKRAKQAYEEAKQHTNSFRGRRRSGAVSGERPQLGQGGQQPQGPDPVTQLLDAERLEEQARLTFERAEAELAAAQEDARHKKKIDPTAFTGGWPCEYCGTRTYRKIEKLPSGPLRPLNVPRRRVRVREVEAPRPRRTGEFTSVKNLLGLLQVKGLTVGIDICNDNRCGVFVHTYEHIHQKRPPVDLFLVPSAGLTMSTIMATYSGGERTGYPPSWSSPIKEKIGHRNVRLRRGGYLVNLDAAKLELLAASEDCDDYPRKIWDNDKSALEENKETAKRHNLSAMLKNIEIDAVVARKTDDGEICPALSRDLTGGSSHFVGRIGDQRLVQSYVAAWVNQPLPAPDQPVEGRPELISFGLFKGSWYSEDMSTIDEKLQTTRDMLKLLDEGTEGADLLKDAKGLGEKGLKVFMVPEFYYTEIKENGADKPGYYISAEQKETVFDSLKTLSKDYPDYLIVGGSVCWLDREANPKKGFYNATPLFFQDQLLGVHCKKSFPGAELDVLKQQAYPPSDYMARTIYLEKIKREEN
ncbi:MAG: hypothetical protein AB7N76_30175 [Planctomycetota bacterium]